MKNTKENKRREELRNGLSGRGAFLTPSENSRYLNRYRLDLKNDEEVMELLEDCFPDITPQIGAKVYSRFCTCIFAFIAYPFTRGELSYLFGKQFGSSMYMVRLSRYVKAGAFLTYDFPPGDASKDMGSMSAYYMSRSTNEWLGNFLPDYMRNKVKIRRSEGYVPLHEYGYGFAILNCMLWRKPLSFVKEDCYSSSRDRTIKKNGGSVCVDATVRIHSEHPFTLYIEQDTGSEHINTLVGKLNKYYINKLTRDERSYMVLSCHQSMGYSPCSSFNASVLSSILVKAREGNFDNMLMFYNRCKDSLPMNERLALGKLLLRVDAAYAFDEEKKKAVRTEEFSVTCKLSRSSTGIMFTPDMLEEYIEELRCGCNDYRMALYNKEQLRKSRLKFHGMVSRLLSILSNTDYTDGEIISLLQGFSCYVVPTCMLANYYPLFDTFSSGLLDNLRNTIKCYIPEIESSAYECLSKSLYFGKTLPALNMRNCFTLADGRLICVEDVSADVGGFIRSFCLMRFCDIVGMKVHLVVLYKEEDEAKFFAKVLACYCNDLYYPTERDNFVTFLSMDEVGNKNALRVAVGSEKDGCVLRPILPIWDDKDEKPAFGPRRGAKGFSEALKGLSDDI